MSWTGCIQIGLSVLMISLLAGFGGLIWMSTFKLGGGYGTEEGEEKDRR